MKPGIMDSREKTSTSEMAGDLDLEPLNLDFELPPIDDSDLVSLDSASDFPALQADFGDLPPLDISDDLEPAGQSISETDTLDAGPSGDETTSADFDAGLSASDFSSDDEAVTLTPDELSDIIDADFALDSELPGYDNMNLEASSPESGSTSGLDELDLELPEDSMTAPDLSQSESSDTADEDIVLPQADDSCDLEPAANLKEDLSIALTDSDDEDVALTEDELDQILGDFDPEDKDEGHTMQEESAQEIEDTIELTDEELQREVIDEDVQMPPLSILDSDDDESITLTPEELSSIVSDDTSSPYGSDEEFLTDDLDPLSAADDVSDPSVETDAAEEMQPSFFEDEDEGPVALTDDELADILEGTIVEEEPQIQQAPMVKPRADRMADELSLETGLKREELRKVIGYLDELLGQLPEETVREFSRSEYFHLYKKVIEELGVFK
jgi:hypothetical protein